MADTETTAAPTTNLAEVSKTESAVEVTTETTESKPETTDSKPEEKATKTDDGEEKWALNGKSEDKNDRRDTHNARSGRDNRGRGNFKNNFKNNHKNDRRKTDNHEFDNLPESDDPDEIRSQIEFYFSAQNLATDEHMFQELEGPKNKPVSIDHICTFKRMRRFKPYSAVVEALRDSKFVELVDDGEYSKPGSEGVKRKEPLVVPSKESDDKYPPTTEQLFLRLKSGASNSNLGFNAYVKGFGDEAGAGQIPLEQFFRPYGAVMVRKRREEDGTWKGSVFVEFESEDSQKQFLALDPKPKFNGNELVTMAKKEYAEMKCAEKGIKADWNMTEEEKREKRKQRQSNGGGQYNKGNNRDRGDRGDRGQRGNRGSSRGGGRGGRGDKRDNNGRDRRDRNRSRSPRRRRDRSASGGSVDSRDWKERRNRFKEGKDDRGSSKQENKEIERDAHGVPVVKDSRVDAMMSAASNKRKAAEDDGAASPKKTKLEIKQDE